MKMRLLIFALGLSTAAFVGCAQHDTTNPDPGSAMPLEKRDGKNAVDTSANDASSTSLSPGASDTTAKAKQNQ